MDIEYQVTVTHEGVQNTVYFSHKDMRGLLICANIDCSTFQTALRVLGQLATDPVNKDTELDLQHYISDVYYEWISSEWSHISMDAVESVSTSAPHRTEKC